MKNTFKMRANIQISFFWVLCLTCSHLDAHPQERYDVISKLEERILIYHDKKALTMPAAVRREIVECDSPDGLRDMSLESKKWLHDNLSQIFDEEAIPLIESLDELKVGDDLFQLLSETFWCRVKEKPIDLDKRIKDIGLYWKETTKPSVEHAPIGKGAIDWFWKLDVKSRPHGTLHVGIDVETRRFLCYEHTIGIYYPEGITLERIRAEIVQDPQRARALGKAYLRGDETMKWPKERTD